MSLVGGVFSARVRLVPTVERSPDFQSVILLADSLGGTRFAFQSRDKQRPALLATPQGTVDDSGHG